ncbi:MAG: HTH domain-containing protein [Rhodobacteraceae bacterium]|nr:HTH domain-containing protein [Paracoccaceae bacterium]
MARGERQDGQNAVADRALDILLSFSDDRPVLTANQLREANNMSRSTIYRYIASLRSKGLITEDQGGGFRLGPRLIAMARIARRGNTILEIAKPFLQEMSEACGEVVQLVERVGRNVIVLEVVESRHRIGITYLRGQMLPSPAGASAKVLLAFAPEDEREDLMKMVDLHPYTAKSITDLASLRASIEEVRRQGYALNDEELDEGIRAIAAPIRGRDGVRYATSIVGPSFRITDEKLPELVALVKRQARQIGERYDA